MSTDEFSEKPITLSSIDEEMLEEPQDENVHEEVLYVNQAMQCKINTYLELTGQINRASYSSNFIMQILHAFDFDPEKAAERYNKAGKKMEELTLKYAEEELSYVEKPIRKHIWKHFETVEQACEYLDDLYERAATKAFTVMDTDFYDHVDKQNEINYSQYILKKS